MESRAQPRPVTLLILALGGEGGGVLAEWIVETAIAQGLPVQATSVPGVAQRTGATSYYIEMLPVPRAAPGARAPVFCLAPTAGQLDLVISSELLETARALERGLPDPARTLLISSTSRFLTLAEKSRMGDGRYDGERVLGAARVLSREALFFDMGAESAAARTALSSVMFGAIAAGGVLPLAREACEATVGRGGASARASLEGFARGFDAIARARGQADGVDPRARGDDPQARGQHRPPAADPARADAEIPAPVREILDLALPRLRDFQDEAWAQEYLTRVGTIVAAERAAAGAPRDGAPEFAASRTAARFLALWMCYEDVIRVADLKTRPERLARIRREVGAREDEPLVLREFLKPGIDEVAAILPPKLAARVRAWGERHGRQALSEGVQLATTWLPGYLVLRALAWLRPLRRRSDRFALERALIERWQAALLRALAADPVLALEIAECPRLLKGYGDTFRRGRHNFSNLLETLIEAPLPDDPQGLRARTAAIRRAREAALADPEGRALASALGQPAPSAREQPLRFVARSVRRS